jgi:hypothetical protein
MKEQNCDAPDQEAKHYSEHRYVNRSSSDVRHWGLRLLRQARHPLEPRDQAEDDHSVIDVAAPALLI